MVSDGVAPRQTRVLAPGNGADLAEKANVKFLF